MKTTSKVFPSEEYAYKAGRRAFNAGKCNTGCCPYRKKAQGAEFHAWQEGWSDGYEVFHGGKES